MVAFDINSLKNDTFRQPHLLDGYATWTEEQKSAFQRDLETCDKSYPGGLINYIERSRTFLDASAKGVNPFEGYEPLVPHTVQLNPGTVEFSDLEHLGLDNVQHLAFVLVAGGLGERLGYNGIKLELPTECTTDTCYLQLYCEYIQALEQVAKRRSGCVTKLPLAIMTSDDTYSKTVELLKKNANFGLDDDQLTIMKQEKVPAVIDQDGKIAQDSETKGLEMKPHGHGDVHSLLMQNELPKTWIQDGRTHMLFLQDTNALIFRILPATLGVCVKDELSMNSICIPRKAGEAVGGICRLVNRETGHEMTLNVEYNQLGPMLEAAGKGGDVPDPKTGNSQFPGNTNGLVFNLKRYQEIMEETGGNIPEFVNPKYADETKMTFKKPTRLECMMQEYPRLLSHNDKVGCVEAPRFACFSTVKNHHVDAAVKSRSGGVPEGAFTGEADVYASNVQFLKLAAEARGCQVEIEAATESTWLDVKYPMGPRVVLKPSFGVCLTDMKERIIEGSKLKITHDSTLVLAGEVILNGLELDGSLSCSGTVDHPATANNVTRKNDKTKFIPATEEDPMPYQIRGYKIECPKDMIL